MFGCFFSWAAYDEYFQPSRIRLFYVTSTIFNFILLVSLVGYISGKRYLAMSVFWLICLLIIFIFISLASKISKGLDYRSFEILVLSAFSIPAYYSVFRNYRDSKLEKTSNK